jgi:rSAM/selenodomain-associated transferase 2/rSAM/selenodomain-associated transferase 1
MKTSVNSGTGRDRLILFGRYPVPGRTKTRLIPFLGPAGAADLQRRLMEKTLRTASSVASRRGLDLEICFEGADENRMRRWLGPRAIYSIQCAGDVGERMGHAFGRAFQDGCRRVILFGTDVPELSAPLLEKALGGLEKSDLVIGPSTDGGYFLVGLKREADLFTDLPWGTNGVLQRTLSRADKLKLSAHLLNPLTDIDTAEDLRKVIPEGDHSGPYLSVIIPALNEAANIEETVQRALCEDSEVIVVDGGSTDGTREKASHAGARVLDSARGRGVQQNRGASAARGKVLLFLHADTHLPGDYPRYVFEALMDPRVVLGAFGFRTDLQSPLARIMEDLVNLRSRYLCLPYGDQGLFLRKTTFELAGCFPDVPIAEDFFLVRHVRKQGRIVTAGARATTSGRRWQRNGLFRTAWINQVILAGLGLRVSLSTLASIYGRRKSIGLYWKERLENHHEKREEALK